jgi:hypothetical protein
MNELGSRSLMSNRAFMPVETVDLANSFTAASRGRWSQRLLVHRNGEIINVY